MKIAKFKGGLGNQLFQCFLRRLKLELVYNGIAKADFTYYRNIENDNIRIPRILRLNTNIANEEDIRNILIFKLNYKIKRRCTQHVSRF